MNGLGVVSIYWYPELTGWIKFSGKCLGVVSIYWYPEQMICKYDHDRSLGVVSIYWYPELLKKRAIENNVWE